MKNLGWARAGAASVAVLLSAAAVAGTGHQWGDFRWTESNTQASLKLSYKFAPSGTNWVPFYDNAIVKWNITSTYGKPLALTSGGEANHTTGAECEPIPNEVLVCAANYGGSEGWVGIAEIDLISGTNQFAWATAKFNDYYYNPDSPYARTYDNQPQRDFVACHEIGHTFGLGHLDTSFNNPNKGSCMDYTSDPAGGGRNKDNRNPGDPDWQVLNSTTMYGTYSGSTKGGPKGGGGRLSAGDPFQFREVGSPSPQGAANGRFGRIVEYDSEGRPVEYVRELSNGHKRVTFVTWAKGYRPEGSR